MATTPTEPERPGYDYTARARGALGGGMPIPLNAELLIFLLVWIFLLLSWILDDRIEDEIFGTWTVALTFGYLISRGIAKAGRASE